MSQQKFNPRPEQMAKLPAVSGNDINGVGETEFRQPSVVYWAEDPASIPHGEMQSWFYGFNNSETLQKARAERANIITVPEAEVSATQVVYDSDKAALAVKAYAQDLGVADCGITMMDPDWSYEGRSVGNYSHVIVLALAQDYDVMATAPEDTAGAEVTKVYGEAALGAKLMTNWIREQGYRADYSAGPMVGNFTMIPAAIRAGLGELGKHGSIIHPQLGSNFRLACVLTNMPMAIDVPLDFGADDFCSKCQICIKACPVDAIQPAKKMVRGVEKYYVDFDACLPFFNEHAGCGICMVACPWSRPDVADKLLIKLAKKR